MTAYHVYVGMYLNATTDTVAAAVEKTIKLQMDALIPLNTVKYLNLDATTYYTDGLKIIPIHRDLSRCVLEVEANAKTYGDLKDTLAHLAQWVPLMAKAEWVIDVKVRASLMDGCQECGDGYIRHVYLSNTFYRRRWLAQHVDVREWERNDDVPAEKKYGWVFDLPRQNNINAMKGLVYFLDPNEGIIVTNLPETQDLCESCLVLNEGTEEEQYWMGVRESDEEEADLLAGRNPYDETHDNEYHAARRRQMLDDLRNGRGL